MAGPLYRLGRFCVRRRWFVLLAWLALAIALAAAHAAIETQTNDDLTLPGTGSQQATDVLTQRFPVQANGTNPVVMEAPAGQKLTDDKFKKPVDDTVKALRDDPRVASAINPLSTDGKPFLSKDERIGYIQLTLKDSPSELTVEDAEEIISVQEPARDAGLTVANGGYLGQKVSKPATESSEAVGLLAAVVILTITFGTVVAMGLPILTAILGLSIGLSLIALLGQVEDVPTVAPTLATMIGLGVGIDYALFIVTRHLSQMQAGMDVDESVARATATSGGAVVFAGGTVIAALVSLLFAGIPLVGTLGYTAAIAVLVAVAAAVTLLPAALAILGPRIRSLKLPLPEPKHDDRPHGWARWAHAVGKNPLPAIIAAVLILAVLAWPAKDLHLGQADTGALPKDTEARQAYDLIAEGFGPGTAGPLLVAVKLDKPAEADKKKEDELKSDHDKQAKQSQADAQKQTQAEAQKLEATGVPPQQALAQAQDKVQKDSADQQKKADEQYKAKLKEAQSRASDPRLVSLGKTLSEEKTVASVSPPLVNDNGSAAIYTVTPTTPPWDLATEDLVKHLRDETLPKATEGQSMTASVGGRTAGFIDLAEQISEKLPIVILVVVGLAFVLLTLAFRSIAIPLKAGLMNLISIGAAFGVVTFVFQEGHGVGLVGLDGPVPVVSFVPLLMFAILFGLSMDYEVFLMSHMQEHYRRNGDNHAAVVDGLAGTARIITSAALIMVFVFGSFILNGDPTVKQFGVGLAVAIAVDATIVRCLLVPAFMAMMGDANWWFPRTLDRSLPSISIEGNEYFARLEAEVAAERAAERDDKPELVP